MFSYDLRDSIKWVYIYDLIRSDLGFNYLDDYNASVILNMLIRGLSNVDYVENRLSELIKNSNVYVVGAGPTCLDELKSLNITSDVIVVADGALRCCLDAGYIPHVVVSDLDGLSVSDLRYNELIYVIHAHGDNVGRLLSYVKLIRGPIVGTTQCIPNDVLRIYGGFTDGDRAVYLAYYFRAKTIRLVGFNLTDGVVGRYSKPWLSSDVTASISKLRKFRWAKLLIDLLSQHIPIYGKY